LKENLLGQFVDESGPDRQGSQESGDSNSKSAPDCHRDQNPNRSEAEFTEGKFTIPGWREGPRPHPARQRKQKNDNNIFK